MSTPRIWIWVQTHLWRSRRRLKPKSWHSQLLPLHPTKPSHTCSTAASRLNQEPGSLDLCYVHNPDSRSQEKPKILTWTKIFDGNILPHLTLLRSVSRLDQDTYRLFSGAWSRTEVKSCNRSPDLGWVLAAASKPHILTQTWMCAQNKN